MAKAPADIRSLCRAYTPTTVKTVAGIAVNGQSENTKLQAIHMLWERGWGKPQQDNTLEIKGEIKVVLRKMLEDDDE